MPDYGWAYINLDVLKQIEGPDITGSIAIIKDPYTLSGSKFLVYATASNKVGIGLDFPTVLPAYQLDVSASSGDEVAARFHGDVQISGALSAERIVSDLIISSSNLVVRDSVIGLGFGSGSALTGAAGDRGFIFGLPTNANQAIIWDQTSGSFVFGKVGAQGPHATAFDIPEADLSILKAGTLTGSVGVSGSIGEFGSITLAGTTITTVVNTSGTPADNQIAIFTDADTIEGSSKLTFNGSILTLDAPLSSSGAVQAVGATTLGSTLNVTGAANFASSVSGSSTLEMVGAATLGNNLFVSGTIKAPSIGTGTDDTVVILDSSGFLRTDEADSRIFGSTLVDGNGSSGQLTLWNDTNTVQGSTSLIYDGSALKIDDAISGSSTLQAVGVTTLGNNLLVSGTIKAPSLGTGTDDTVVILDSSGFLKTDEADSRIFGTTLVDGNGSSGQITLWNDTNTVQGSTSLTYDGSTFINDNNYSGSGGLQNVGNAIFGGDVSVSGTVKVADKIEHAGDADTFINFTTDDLNFQAGGVNFFDLSSGSSGGNPDHEITFNEGGVDVDFRVETADESHMLFIEGSSNRMSIGDNTGSPGATLEIKNHATAGATGVPLLQLNNNDTDQQCVDINAGNIDANVVNITANDVTTARVLAIGADGLTTGNALYVDDNSSNTGTRNTALIIQNNAAAINAKALAIQSDGGKTGVKIDKNYSDTTEASVVGLDIDWDKTGASTSDNTMYGIQIDMDNTTATNGNNTMYGLHVTPTLTHAANAGTPIVYGALINAQGGTNGTSLVQAARFEAGGGDINYGIQLDVEDGGVDLRIESSADNGDYFQIQTTTHGATTITTQDDNATAADLTFTIDGDINLAPVGSVGINSDTPTALFHISASTGQAAVPEPLFRIDHPGDASGKEFTEALFYVTGTIPDDYFEAHVGINTKQPEGALHVKSKEGGNTLVVRDDKVVIGHNSAASKFHIRQGVNSAGDKDVVLVESLLSDDTTHNLFYVTGSTDGTGRFGSFNTGSVLMVSGSSNLADVEIDGHLKMTSGIMLEYLTVTDEDAQNVTLSAAEFKKGIVVHTSTTGEGTVTMDTAANLISGLSLTADNMTAHCYYINDGNQNVLVSGAATGVTYADTGCKIKENCAATILVRRTGASAVTVYVIGGS